MGMFATLQTIIKACSRRSYKLRS